MLGVVFKLMLLILVAAQYSHKNETETIYRVPDKIGNLFKTKDRTDRKYSKGGRLEQDARYNYYYDAEGNLLFKEFRKNEGFIGAGRKETEKLLGIKLAGSGTGWRYNWAGNGMLQQVVNPHGSEVHFSYDPLGRRIAKQYKGVVTRWLWDGNVPLHEWRYEGGYPPKAFIDEEGKLKEEAEPVENLITWVYEEGSFVPCAKITAEEQYSIVADYLGTPTHAYNSTGEKVWERELDIYGAVRTIKGDKNLIPQLYQGQWVDSETGLAYNRHRYYDNEAGNYISQDPIRLAGGRMLYGYVWDTNKCLDPLGLTAWGDLDMDFDTWFNQASVADIENNMKDVTSNSGLRNGGGKHEMFPVSMAPKAKELGFTAEELKAMSVPTKDITFQNVPNNKTGAILPNGKHHQSQASSHFHTKLMEKLEGAKTKADAQKIIKEHHDAHMKTNHH